MGTINGRYCYVCGALRPLHLHHVFEGARKSASERRGFLVYLCVEHHTGNTGVHHDRALDLRLKRACQRYYENRIGTREEFIKEFRRSYL